MVQEDQEILEITSDLCQQLKITKYNPGRVHWLEPRRGLYSDQPLVILNQLALPMTLMGKLSPAEWKPLIASALIYGRKFRGRRLRGLTRDAIIGYLLALALLPISFLVFYLSLLFGASQQIAAVIALFAMIAAVSPLYGLRQAGKTRKMRLLSDQEAAKLVGREIFLEVLRKIDGLGLWDVEERKRRRSSARFSFRPSVIDRIKSLENISAFSKEKDYHWPYFSNLNNLVTY